MNVIFLGDVFGKPGREIVHEHLNRLIEYYEADFIIINGENLADGKGLTQKTAKPLFDAGISAITSGNHLWDRKESFEYLQQENRIIKPLNYPTSALGSDFITLYKDGDKLTVLCLTGQMFMSSCNSPYQAFLDFYVRYTDLGAILVDFHAESTAEKRAFAHMFDGQVSAVIGTHTHIQTSDEEILPYGTGYITDAGMTGPHNSVIGIKKHLIIEKLKTGMPIRYEVANDGLQINGVFLSIDPHTRKTTHITRIRELI